VALQYADETWGTPTDAPETTRADVETLALDLQDDMLSVVIPEDMDMATVFPESDFQAESNGDMDMSSSGTELLQIVHESDPVFETGQFHFGVNIRANAAEQNGQVLDVQDKIGMHVSNDDVAVKLYKSNGDAIELTTMSDILSDRNWHNVSVAYDGVEEVLKMIVDQEVVDEVSVAGLSEDVAAWQIMLEQMANGESIGEADGFALQNTAEYYTL
jgi:hypothetical protein